jgi:hypothetical protein
VPSGGPAQRIASFAAASGTFSLVPNAAGLLPAETLVGEYSATLTITTAAGP